MANIPIEAHVSTEQLLHAVEQLPSQELAAFVERLLALRAQRQGAQLGPSETALVLQINKGIDPLTQRRFDELVAKRQNQIITSQELDELIAITDAIEAYDARRLQALDDLATLRHVPLADVMTSLGIPPPTYA